MRRAYSITFLFVVLFMSASVFGQDTNNKNNQDKTMRSNATVNPTSLGMELSIPLGAMPGRSGNSLPITLSYSSKVWRIDTFKIFGTEYSYPKFGDDSDSGWTTSLQAPYLEETSIIKEIQPNPTPTPGGPPPPPPGTNIISCTATWSNGTNTHTDSTCSCRVGATGVLYLITSSCSNPPPNPQFSSSVNGPHYIIPKKTLHLPDGSTHELVSTLDAILVNSTNPLPPQTTYFSIDGSNLRLEVINGIQVLFLSNGSRYEFREEGTGVSSKYVADNFDVNGNKLTYEFARDPDIQGDMEGFVRRGQWQDSMGRTIAPPKPPIDPNNPRKIVTGDVEYSVPTMPNHQMVYIFKWRRLEDAFAKTTYVKKYLRDLFSDVGISEIDGEQFNPVILKEIVLPNNTSYRFLYNERAEIENIFYPTGVVEEFTYGVIPPFSHSPFSGLSLQGNRGVTSRIVKHDSNPSYDMDWSYQILQNPYRIAITAPDRSSNERRLFIAFNANTVVPRLPTQFAGKPYEERSYSTTGTLVARMLTKWVGFSTTGSGGGCNGYCGGDGDGGPDPNLTSSSGSPAPYAVAYPRIEKQLSIMIEGGAALAKMNEMEYDSSSNPFHFAQMNVKKIKNYDFVWLDLDEAQSSSLVGLQGYFSTNSLLNSSETDYVYNAGYLTRGITSLPIESRTKDKSGNVITKSQTIYDNALPNSASNYGYSMQTYGTGNSYDCSGTSTPTICWQNPNGQSGNIDMAYRGLPTTSRVWNSDNSTWIESHVQYDQFGNAVKARDPIGNEATTIFENSAQKPYKYAYPTQVITPAPDPTNTTGTNQTSTASTTYDFNTGLPLTVTDDFGQVVRMEYNDPLLRPTRTFGENFTAPETQTIYGDTPGNLFVKVRKQIDTTNWDEATTFADSLGRKVKTVAKDSQGDVTVETKYDTFGRVAATSNPYRTGETVYWSKPRYDELNRVVETYAPEAGNPLDPNIHGASLGVTSFAISTVTDYVGAVVTTTDASGRKGRSITNALGQLVRVDEPTATGGTADADLGALATPAQPTYYKYSPQGKMVQVTQGVQNRYFKYDSLGRLVRVKQPEQEVNSPGLDLTDTYNTSGQWTAGFTYDVLGNVVTATDAKGTVITNAYDRASRVTARTYNDSTPAVSFYYDGKGLTQTQNPNYAKGKLTKVFSTISETKNTEFDNFGRLKETQQITDGNTYTSKYTYNLSGALIEEEYPSGRKVKNEFESDGDLRRIYGVANANATEKTYANAFSYTPDGKIEKLKLGNGLWEAAKFNTRLQTTEIALGHGVTSGDLWKLGYEYGEIDANGNVNTTKNTGNIARQTVSFSGLTNPFVQTYKYDSLYRLTEAKETSGISQNWIQTFGYDRYGNRTSTNQIVNGATINTTPAIDPNTNRFTSSIYHFDKNGNLDQDVTTNNQSRTTVFNGDNRQTEVKDANGTTIGRYYFDGEGKRVKKKVYDPSAPVVVKEETIFVYSSGKLIAEYSTAPPPQTPTTNYTATDMLGSPRVLTNSLGEVVSRRDFLPFGEEVLPDGTNRTPNQKYVVDGVRQKFTGYQKDEETQLDFAEARMYENRHGRFTAVDPLLASGKSANPQTFNRYVYCLNNPLALTDPKGLQAGWAIDHRDHSPSGTEEPWVYFQYFQGPASRDTHNAANAHNFQPFEGQFYLYGDHKFANLSSSGVYTEGLYTGPDTLGWDAAIENQKAGDTKAVDSSVRSFMYLGFTELLGSKNDNVTHDPALDNIHYGVIPFSSAPGNPFSSFRSAQNAATAPQLASQLTKEEASSVFTPAGGLRQNIIQQSTRFDRIAGNKINNPNVISELTKDGSNIVNWAKYYTQTFRSPSGPFQVHFYHNPITRSVNYNVDFKVVFNARRVTRP